MEIRYPSMVEDIPDERQKELEQELAHFSIFSPCERLRFVEKEWLAFKDYIKRFGYDPQIGLDLNISISYDNIVFYTFSNL